MDTHDYDVEEVRDAYRASIIAGTVGIAALLFAASVMLSGCLWAMWEIARAVRP